MIRLKSDHREVVAKMKTGLGLDWDWSRSIILIQTTEYNNFIKTKTSYPLNNVNPPTTMLGVLTLFGLYQDVFVLLTQA